MPDSFFIIEPEVAGGLGPHTEMDRSVHPPRVLHLHYVFDGWLGDHILESTPCWIVTEDLAKRIRQARLTGVELGEVEVEASDQFRELYPDRSLPKFERLLVTGRAKRDDFGVGADGRLVVSDLALKVVQSTNPSNLLVEAAG